jgi:hypothetical protein
VSSWVEPADLFTFMGYPADPSDPDVARAEAMINAAEGMVRGRARQQLDYLAGDVVVLDPQGLAVQLPELPVQNVDTLSVWVVDPATLVGSWQVYDPSQWNWSSDGVVTATWSTWWPSQPRTVQVTYDHGYTTIPSELITVTLSLAARLASNPLHLQGQATGGISQRFEHSSKGDFLLDIEEDIIARFSRPTAA